MSFTKIKSLAKDSLIYGMTGIISRMISVFLVPVYTRIFQPSDYGIISLVNTTFLLIGMLAIFGLDNAAARWYYDTNDEVERRQTIASWFWFQLGAALVLASILLLASPLFSKYLLKMPLQQMWPIWLLACCTLITNILPSIIWRWYRFSRRPKATMIFTLSQSLLTIGLTILFVVVLHWGIIGVYAALFIASLVFSIIALVQLRGWINFHFFQKARIREMLRFSLPLVPASLAFWLLNSTDAYFIQLFKGRSEVGLFSVGASLASGVALFTGAFQQAWGPFAFSIINEPDAKKTYANVFLVFGVASSVILLGMFLFSPEILKLLTTPQYHGSAWVASILSINVILIAFTYIASIGTSIVKNNKHYSIGVLLAASITVILDILFIPKWGKEGSAIATVLAQAIVPVYLFYHAHRMYTINYQYKKVAFFILLSIALGITGRYIEVSNTVAAVLFKISIILIFMFCTFLVIRKNLSAVLRRATAKKKSMAVANRWQ